MDRGFTYSPWQASISGGHNLIFVYAEKGNVVLRYEDHTPASHLFHPVHLPTHISQFLSSFVTCYKQYVCAATNDTYPRKEMSGLTNTNDSVLLLSVRLFVSMSSVCLYVHLPSVCKSVGPPVCMCACRSFCPTPFLSVHPPVSFSSCRKSYCVTFPLVTPTSDIRMPLLFTLDSFFPRWHISHFSLFLERDYPWKVTNTIYFPLDFHILVQHCGPTDCCKTMNHLQLHLLPASSCYCFNDSGVRKTCIGVPSPRHLFSSGSILLSCPVCRPCCQQ